MSTSDPEKFIAVMYSCNKINPIVYEILLGKNEVSSFIESKHLEYVKIFEEEEELKEEELKEEELEAYLDENCEIIPALHNGEKKYLKIRRYKITDKNYFADNTDCCVAEHLDNVYDYDVYIAIIHMENCTLREVMRDFW